MRENTMKGGEKMEIKPMLDGLILPALSRLAPEAEPADLKYFGGAADFYSPLVVKYGIDTDSQRVYNIMKQTALEGVPLFLSARVSGGFISLRFTDAALEKLAEASCGLGGSLIPRGVFPAESGLLSVHARLCAIYYASDDEFSEIKSSVLRRAFLHVLLASSGASFNTALAETEEAIRAHRRALASAEREAVISGRAARAMALALSRKFEKYDL